MIFGIPWPFIIPIVAIVGGLFYAYKAKELKLEEKRMGSAREIHELKKAYHHLKSRIEKLESDSQSQNKNTEESTQNSAEIEFDDDLKEQNDDNSGGSTRRRSSTR